MNSTMQRRAAIVGLTMLTGAALAVTGSPASASTAGTNSSANGVHANYHGVQARHSYRWVRVGEFDTRRGCERAGWRGERRDLWNSFRCVRDDRDGGGYGHGGGYGGWDRRGGYNGGGYGDWDRGGRHRQDCDYVLYVKRSWHR